MRFFQSFEESFMVKMARVHQPLGLILGFCLTTAALAAPTAAKGPNLDSDARKLSYSVGISLGNRLRDDFTNLDMEALTAGLRHGLDGTKPALSEEEMQKIFADWSSKKTAADQQARESAAKKNSSEGEAFLKSHGKESGVTTLPSGIQYKVIKQGSGKSPTLEDSVVVHYRGSLLDGTEFDSSRKRGAPATFPVRGLIPGWTEVLQKMKEGDQWEVVIPAELAYGDQGAGRKIGPNAVLRFDMELLQVQGGESGAAAPAPAAQ
jgi:FKBP-type peptidyl-prolyl cis-trans isomerase FklB